MKTKPRKKKREKLNGLDDDQRTFIENRVRSLGSLEAVKRTYRANDTVSSYALMLALNIYKDAWPVIT